ncbi:hypothetical protein [Mesohalobacter halotolerans]|uniref:hypothetical protein n=1 Tax=Mesohalobacter halotolerans TaxID=1883405 RepID=UPI0014871510|nr:hypothetical protein [Mesohalobacter halotolerans]
MDEIENMKDAVISMDLTLQNIQDRIIEKDHDVVQILNEMKNKLSEINYNLENIR